MQNFQVGLRIADEVLIGNSIVKKLEQSEIEVYRRDLSGEWMKLDLN